ncbi:hypothetical protein [Streptomyces niveus]|uniref:hypothetical protein n=1 Tax=Streptomyces niveus TaxID=193462 RepID=UPI003F4E9EA0
MTTNTHAGRSYSLPRQMANKVPEVTLYFWVIKVLCTTVGETAADLLNADLGLGLVTTSYVMAGLLARKTVPSFSPGKASTVTRHDGRAVLLTYQGDSAPDEVTGKTVRDAFERYSFHHQGREVDLTLSGPVGADNVDPWRIVSDSLRWQ